MSDPHPYAPYAEAFGKFVPGFEFLQGLARNAGQGLPGIGQWVAPTLDPQELERRIGELRTVQFWLEQNARMIATTIQALEVQRMTLGTLRSMNIPMGDLTEALRMRVPDPFAAAAAPTPAPAPAPAPAAAPAAAEEGPAAVDPMQWWGALTQQFTQLASQAVKATSEATAEAQARAADAMQGVMQSVAEATPVVTPATASAPEPKAARKRAAPARKAEPEPAPAPAARRRTPRT